MGYLAPRRHQHASGLQGNISCRMQCCNRFNVVMVVWMIRGCASREELSGDGTSTVSMLVG